MKKTLRLTLIVLFAFAGQGCDDLIVKDISKMQVEVLTPSENAILSDGAVIFSWETLEFADYYRLIVASSSFSNITQTVVDTLVSGNHFEMETPLSGGSYQWRLQALNAEYRTLAQMFSFQVETADDVSGESL